LARPAFCDEADFNTSDPITKADGDGILCSGTNDDINNDTACQSIITSSKGCFYGANYTIGDSTSHGILEHDISMGAADALPYTESTQSDGGYCLAYLEDGETSCDAWPTSAYCDTGDVADDPESITYSDEASCTGAGFIWSETINIFDDPNIYDTGDCVDIEGDYDETPSGDEAQNGRYGDTGVDAGSVDKICFYNVDGTGSNEVRSTKECSSDSNCREADPDSYNCVQLMCQNGDTNEACSVGGSQCDSTPAAMVENPYEVRPLRWQLHDPWDANHTGDGEGDYEIGLITRIPANEILRNIHASEMEQIEFNPGSAGEGGGAGDEYPFWGQLNGTGEPNMYDLNDTEALTAIGNIWLTDLKNGAIETETEADGSTSDIEYKPLNCYAHADGNDLGFGCRYWGLWDADFEWSKYEENNLASLSNQSTGHKYDLIYTWIWSNFDWGIEESDGTNCAERSDESDPQTSFTDMTSDIESVFNLWWISECIDSSLRTVFGPDQTERNPWGHIESSTWDNIYVENPTTEQAETVIINNGDIDGWDGWGHPDDEDNQGQETGASHAGGSNMLSLYVDFSDDGYIQAVYVLEWVGAQDTQDSPAVGKNAGVELTYANMMHLDIQTRESCVLVAESVSPDGETYAWANRFSNGGYEINHGTDTYYDVDEPYEPYGSITPSEDSPDSGLWDYLANDYESVNAWSTFGMQPLIASPVDTFNAGHPLSCVGDCSERACVSSPQYVGEPCDSNDECDGGICMGIGDTTISNNGVDAAYNSGEDQIDGVVSDARERLKYVVAGMKSGKFYSADFTDEDIYTEDNRDLWSTNPDDASVNTNIFDNMILCATDDGTRPLDNEGNESEYCGVLPTVSAITINDTSSSTDGFYSITNGQTVTLKFTAQVDGEQMPLNNIYVDWGDGTSPVNELWEANPTTHTYTHAYNCGSDNGDRHKGNHCEFKPKIVIIDNWDWCSGLQSGTCSDPIYETEEECEDQGKTWTNGTGDHRYDVSSGSNNLISQCQSYDEPSITIYVDATS